MGKQDSLILQRLRKQIDLLDEQIINALNERAAAVEAVWLWKQENNYPFIDQGRERAIIQKARSLAKGSLSEDAAESIFQCILQELRPNLQKAKKLG